MFFIVEYITKFIKNIWKTWHINALIQKKETFCMNVIKFLLDDENNIMLYLLFLNNVIYREK